ncbi:MAG: glycoside hydrolase family 43 protein [Treponema sp.]|jgi:GH43 family beta-xylosidase|nr:glycoside hydrolase family 43 protein [Treponema sp.]
MRISDIQIRDPFIVREDGRYYLFGSTDKNIWEGKGTGFDGYVSLEGAGPDAPADFEGPFAAFRPADGFWSETNFWAPEVHRYKGSWYMFATFKPRQGGRGTAVLKSESGVKGPYAPWSLNAGGASGPVTPADWECLDGTFFIEGETPYLVFCREWRQVGDGQICAMPLTEDIRRAAAAPKLLFRASEAPWVHEPQGRAPGTYVTDGPFMHRTGDGALLMLWSSFDKDGNYCTGTARSRDGTLTGPWTQSGEPLHNADGGHGMIFRGTEGTLYLVIHRPNKTPFERPVFIEITEKDGAITVQKGKVVS